MTGKEGEFQEEFTRKIIFKCHYCHNHSTAWIHIFSILSTIIYSTCAVPISTFGGTRPIPTISQGDGETFRFNKPQEQPVRTYIPCLTCTFQQYNWNNLFSNAVLQHDLHRLGWTIRLEVTSYYIDCIYSTFNYFRRSSHVHVAKEWFPPNSDSVYDACYSFSGHHPTICGLQYMKTKTWVGPTCSWEQGYSFK